MDDSWIDEAMQRKKGHAMNATEIREGVARLAKLVVNPKVIDRVPKLHKDATKEEIKEHAERMQEVEDAKEALKIGSDLLAQFLVDIHQIAQDT